MRFALLLVVFICPPLFAGKVVGVADGDTLTILGDNQEVRVRLANIDAPEKKQAYGQRSKQSLSDLCFERDATLDISGKDRNGRIIATVYCDGINANTMQIMRGLAWVYTKYNRDPALPEVERYARESKTGLWSDAEPVPPWQYRKERKRHNSAQSNRDPYPTDPVWPLN